MKHLKECVVLDGDFNQAFDDATADDWIFIDPPYRDRLGYTQGDGGEDLHDQLVDRMVSTQSKWLFIHTECDYYKDKLSDYHIIKKPFGYGQRFGKGRNHANASVSHMYVTNYENDMTLHYAAQPNLLEICNNT
jgi:DNA adenine methylase